VRVARFDALGHRAGFIEASAGTLVQAVDADPVVAITPSDDVVVVYTDFGGDGDSKGIAARVISAATTTAQQAQYIAQQRFGAQYAPDIIALSDGLIVAWTDAGAALSAPDIRYRELSFDLKPLGDEKTLSAAGNVQGRVVLAPLGSSWGATWRSSNGEGLETTEVYDAASGARFSVPAHLPASAEEVPALLPLDDTHRMLVFTAGVNAREPGDAGVGDVYTNQLYVAGLDTSAPGTVTAQPVPVTSAYQSFMSLPRRRPALVRTQTEAYLAWWSGAARGSVQGEDVWLERLTASSAGGTLSITLGGEQRLPRWATELGADQRFPALVIGGAVAANSGGSLFAAWEDYSGAMPGASHPEVVAQLAPLPLVRSDSLTTPCGTTTATRCSAGKGPCNTQLENQDCQPSLVCRTGRGPQFDYDIDVAVCMAAHCANNVKDQDETGLDCGGADCGTCMCGDGVSSPLLGEVCDEGHQSTTCETNCQEPTCGDSIVNPWRSEQCDDGNNVNTDDCVACVGARCGDGYLWPMHEQCELATAGCNSQCRWPSCGNGVVNTGEQCDDGNTSNTDLCVFGCRAATCGDGFIRTATEACDAGLGLNCVPENCDAKYDPNCNPTTCTAPVGCTTSNSCLGAWSQMQTGLTPSETPTDARIAETFRIRNNRATGTAAVALDNIKLRYWFTRDSNQLLAPVCDAAAGIGGCGNVHLTTAAVTPVYRGADTVLEMTFSGGLTLQPASGTGDIKVRLTISNSGTFTETGDFSFINTTTITANPNMALYDTSTGQLLWGNEPHAVPFCGDQIVDAGEACDRGIEMADCTAVCTISSCGDGILNRSASEVCDASGVNTPACDTDCTVPACGDGIVNTAAGEVCDPSVSSNCKPDCTGFVSTLLCTTASSCLHVDQKVEDNPTTDDKIAPVLRLVNSGDTDVNLNDLTVRYWFTGDPATATFTPHCDYASLNNFTNQCGNVNRIVTTMATSVTQADHFLQITFGGGVVLVKNTGSTNDIKLRISRSASGNFNELNDWSYINSTGYVAGTHITIYNSTGQLIWGQEP
jgi:cysteine-rich repeat protein